MFLQKVKDVYKIIATGEMYKEDLEKGGEWYELRLEMEKLIEDAGGKAKVKPFDQYQGPFAEVSLHGKYLGKLWAIDENKWFFEGKKKFEGDYVEMVDYIKSLVPSLKPIPGGKPSWLPTSDFSKRPDLKLIKSMVEKYLKR